LVFTGLGVALLSQITGVEAATYYSDIILMQVGLSTQQEVFIGTILIGIVKVSFVVVAAYLVDKMGRRPLLLISCLMMSACLYTFAVAAWFFAHAPYLKVAAFMGFVSSFSLGVGPMAYIIPAEVFPMRLRGKGMSMAMLVCRLVSSLVAITYLSLQSALTQGGVHMFYATMCALGIVFVCRCVPETKGKSLEQVEALFA